MGPPDYASIHQYVVDALPSDALEKAKKVFHMGKARVEKIELFAKEALAAAGFPASTKAKKKAVVAKKAAKKPARSRKRPTNTKSKAAGKRKAREGKA